MDEDEIAEPLPVTIRKRAETEPGAALIEDVEGGALTNAGFHERATRIADALALLGVAKGDCVVSILETSLEAYLLWIGTCWLGAMEVPINPEFRGSFLTYGANDSRARLLVTTNAMIPHLEAVWDDVRHVEHVVTMDDTAPPSRLPLRTMASLIGDAPHGRYPDPASSDVIAVIYTSGTTGASKGVVVPWGNFQPQQMFSGDRHPADVPMVYYSTWPTFHSSGRIGLAKAVAGGGHLVIRKRFSTTHFWDDIRRFGCSHAQLMGIAGYIMGQPARPDDADNPLRCILMNPVIDEYRAFEARFGVRISTGWGMTEIGFPLAAMDLPNARTCGRLSPLYEARIVDERGREVPDGTPGEMMVRARRSGILFKEYLNKPEATAAVWQDGWFRTGDVLRRDEDGYFYFLDRAKDYLRVRGNNISSAELEAEVRQHPDVEECAAIGVSRDKVPAATGDAASATEDELKIVVMLGADASLTEAGLVEYLRPRVPRFMIPRFVEFVPEYPRTPTGKIQKQVLRQKPMTAATWDRLAS